MITINRHNYEEYFLLYVDNELAAEDKLAVERFVEQNPDLGEELGMLQQAILPGEQVVFSQKERLYNQEEGVTSKNYETYFLLSVDQELTKAQSEEVERFVLKHPEVQNQFTLLQQTRLEPELVEFEGKETLYRKSKERAPIVLQWVRMSAAAAIIGIIGLAWFFSAQNTMSSATDQVAVIENKTKPAPPAAQQDQSKVTEQPVAALQKKSIATIEKTAVKVAISKRREQRLNRETALAGVKKQVNIDPVDKTIKSPVIPETQESRREAFEKAIASAKITKSIPAVPVENGSNPGITLKNGLEESSFRATPVAYREINNAEDEEKTIYIGSAGINKNKLKGIFRKAAGLFEKKGADNDDERTLRIAGFEIKTK